MDTIQVETANELTTYSSYVLKLPYIVISIPYYIYNILTYSFTLTLDFKSLTGIKFYLLLYHWLNNKGYFWSFHPSYSIFIDSSIWQNTQDFLQYRLFLLATHSIYIQIQRQFQSIIMNQWMTIWMFFELQSKYLVIWIVQFTMNLLVKWRWKTLILIILSMMSYILQEILLWL